MYYADLQAAVNTSSGPRSDIPDHVYSLALAEINRDIRIKEMQQYTCFQVNPSTLFHTITTLDDPVATALPADFLEAEEVYNTESGKKKIYLPELKAAQTEAANEYARTYAITNDGITLTGAPAEEFTLEMVYYKANDRLTNGGDTNPVLLKHPDLYLEIFLSHTAKWKLDLDEASLRRS